MEWCKCTLSCQDERRFFIQWLQSRFFSNESLVGAAVPGAPQWTTRHQGRKCETEADQWRVSTGTGPYQSWVGAGTGAAVPSAGAGHTTSWGEGDVSHTGADIVGWTRVILFTNCLLLFSNSGKYTDWLRGCRESGQVSSNSWTFWGTDLEVQLHTPALVLDHKNWSCKVNWFYRFWLKVVSSFISTRNVTFSHLDL